MTLKAKKHSNKKIITPFGDKYINDKGVVEGLTESQEKHLSVLKDLDYTETPKPVKETKEETKEVTEEKPKRTRRTKKTISEDEKK
ncbi:hypothetical protein RND61_15020 [Streptomyces sp. TRM76323]|uniref:DUF7349 domain-containing protein n=1 Tax=Streptomyces tamarix TaxID=3078565 RepID=A0ABU3QKS7_9ACTN|nr:hypothetical protein [Streptomyces tamarix]MDT9683375.1 hypothetical protein [Streptomyces tamarix]